MRPEYAENVTGEQFSKILDHLRNEYAYVLVDTSAILTDSVLAAMDSSDLVVLHTTQDIPAIKNARMFLDLAAVLTIDRRRILFVMNRFDKRIGITPDKISENLRHDIVAVIPADERVVIPSINRGVPFMLGNRSTPVAKAVLSLADVIRQRLEEQARQEEEPVATGLFRKSGKR
jgi:pilus assembly protein CpaE